jgi:hypothetical protein
MVIPLFDRMNMINRDGRDVPKIGNDFDGALEDSR